MPPLPTTFQSPVLFGSTVTFNSTMAFAPAVIPPSAIGPGTTGNFMPAESVRHQIRKLYVSGNNATVVASEQKIIYRAYKPGNVIDFNAGCVVIPVGAATVTVDLKKNNVSILSAVITLNNASVSRVGQIATLGAGYTYATGDLFEVNVVATAGGGTLPNGVWGEMTSDEDPL